MSHFDGIITEYPNIACDRFCGDALTSTAFFLSHCHTGEGNINTHCGINILPTVVLMAKMQGQSNFLSDTPRIYHMEGLQSDAFFNHLNSNSLKLYCSPITKRFLSSSKKHKHLKKNICCLRLNETHSVSIQNPNAHEEETVNVTFFKAKHCPGSVMILFESNENNVLYTGDFRLNANSLTYTNVPLLYEASGKLKSITKLYVDTTFCSEAYQTFPSKIESRNLLIDAVEAWLKSDARHLVFLDCPYRFGCEYLFMELHKKFNMKIHVSKSKYFQYKLIPKLKNCTSGNPSGTQIHACCSIKKKNRNKCMIFADTNADILYIKLSAMYFANGNNDSWVYQFPKTKRYRICYSIHASCQEIQGFVKKLQPCSVHPLVVPPNSDIQTVNRLLGVNSDQSIQADCSHRFRKFGQLCNQSLESEDNLKLGDDFVLDDKAPLSPPNLSSPENQIGSPEWSFTISPLKASQESTFSDVAVVKELSGIQSSSETSIKDQSDLTKDFDEVTEIQEPQNELNPEILNEFVVNNEYSIDGEVEVVYDKKEVIDLTNDSEWDTTPELIFDT